MKTVPGQAIYGSVGLEPFKRKRSETGQRTQVKAGGRNLWTNRNIWGEKRKSVSLLLSCIQGYRYHLSKFHIYALVYCIGFSF